VDRVGEKARTCGIVAGLAWLAVTVGCWSPEQVCSTVLVATLQPDAADTALGGVALSTSLALTPATSAGAAWQAAVDDAAHVPASLGIVALPQRTTAHVADPNVGRVVFGLPFPLVKGQTVALMPGAIDPAGFGLEMANAAGSSDSTSFEVDTCPTPTGSTSPLCAPAAGQSVTGTLTVSSSQPLHVRIDATLTGPGASPDSTVVSADLTFAAHTTCSAAPSGVRID